MSISGAGVPLNPPLDPTVRRVCIAPMHSATRPKRVFEAFAGKKEKEGDGKGSPRSSKYTETAVAGGRGGEEGPATLGAYDPEKRWGMG